jgi:hypothetical protein
MSIHLELAELIESEFAPQLAAPLQRKQDALLLELHNGVSLSVRYAAADAYSLRWSHAGQEAGIDTAPLHPQLATFPNHMHAADGRLLADPLTRPDQTPAENLRRLLAALLADPTAVA